MDIKKAASALGLYELNDGYHYDGESLTFTDEWEFIGITLTAPNLRSVTLPSTVNRIHSKVFRKCPKLREVIVPEDNETFFARDGMLYMKEHMEAYIWYANGEKNVELIMPDGIERVGCYAFNDNYSVTSVTMPSSLKDVGYTAFSKNDTVTRVLIRNSDKPDKKIELSQWAFRYCLVLKSVIVEYGAPVELSTGVFQECRALEEAVIPSCTGEIPENAFYYCRSLKSFYVPEGVTKICRDAFYCCRSLESVTLPYGLKMIESNAFFRCESLAEIVIPDSVTDIDYSVFGNTGVVSAKLGRGMRKIPSGMFGSCEKLRNIEIPDNILIIDENAFSECTSLESVTLPDGLRIIKSCAFYGCTDLKHITIPSSVTTLADSAFWKSGLESITYRGKTYDIRDKEEYDSVMSAIIKKVEALDQVTPKLKKTVWFWVQPDPYMDEFEYISRDDDDEGFWDYKIVDEDYVLRRDETERKPYS